MNTIERTMISDGVCFSSIRDSRFKTMKISANIIVPLSEETASANALLCGVLSRSCKAYPDFTRLSKKLCSLYGADISVSITKAGDCQVLRITVSGLDDRYAFDGESIACELSSLLCSVIFEPNITDNAFAQSEVEQERRQLLDLIDAEFNDKRIYANGQLIKNMCADEVFGIMRYGTPDKIKEITPQSLYQSWQTLLKTARFEIIYVGDSPADKALQVFTDAFANVKRNVEKLSTDVKSDCNETKHVCETMSELSQSKLVMGFRTGIAIPDERVNAAKLMCAILGGTASSKLFNNVREKQSLCYYCASRFDSHKGIMTIDSGVEGDNLEKAEKAILKEVDDMKNGVISDFEIEATKMAVINSFRTTNDTVSGIESWYTNQILGKSLKTVEEVSAEMEAVTKEEIVSAAKSLVLDTVYQLSNQ